MPVRSRSKWNLGMLVFEERGKLEYLEKNLSEQTQTKYGIDARIQTGAKLVGSEHSHHCSTLAHH